MFRKIAFTATAAVVCVSLSGCSVLMTSEATSVSDSDIATYTVELGNGDNVNCLLYDGFEKAGLQCDWKNLNVGGYDNADSKLGLDSHLTGSTEKVGETSHLCVTYSAYHEGALDCNF